MKTKEQLIYMAKAVALELVDGSTTKNNKHLENTLQTELRVLCDVLDDDLPEWLCAYIEQNLNPSWL